MIVVALQRTVVRHMAVQTARTGQDGCNVAERQQTLVNVSLIRLWASRGTHAQLQKAKE
jgi:hypothetical protein